jgi:ribosomal protein L20
MPRVKRGVKRRARRAKYLKLAKGYRGAKSHNYRTAKEAVEKSLLYAYHQRFEAAARRAGPQSPGRPGRPFAAGVHRARPEG